MRTCVGTVPPAVLKERKTIMTTRNTKTIVEKIFPARLKEERSLRGLSQGELAELAGLDRKTINRIENEHYSPSLESFISLCHALNLEPNVMLAN